MALFENDPLDAVAQWFIRSHVHDIWLTRRFTPLVAHAGFEPGKIEGHSYLAEGEAAYFRSVIGRGADLMDKAGLLAAESARALILEADRRIRTGTFFGSILFVRLIAKKP